MGTIPGQPSLPNVTTQDTYAAATTMAPDFNIAGVRLEVYNANVFAQYALGTGEADWYWSEPEQPLSPSVCIADCYGVRVRSLVPGAPAQVIAVPVLGNRGPKLDQLSPLLASLTPVGGWAPPLAQVKAYANSLLVGSEIGLNLVQGPGITIVGVDEPANSWSKLTVSAASGLIQSGISLPNDVVSNLNLTTFASFLLPQGGLNANGMWVADIIGDYLNNTLANQTLRLRLSFGGTVVLDTTSGNIATAAGRRSFNVRIVLMALGSVALQRTNLMAALIDANVPAVGAGGTFDGGGSISFRPITGIQSAVDTSTQARFLNLDVQHSASSNQLSIRNLWANSILTNP